MVKIKTWKEYLNSLKDADITDEIREGIEFFQKVKEKAKANKLKWLERIASIAYIILSTLAFIIGGG